MAYIYIYIYAYITAQVYVEAEPALHRLYKYLVDDYVMVLPRINSSDPVRVTTRLEFCNLMGLVSI